MASVKSLVAWESAPLWVEGSIVGPDFSTASSSGTIAARK